MSAHDRYLANYRTGTAEVWCTNVHCPNHTDSVTVAYFSEYGQGWLEPEDCPSCGGEWQEDAPEPVAPHDPQLSEAENAA